MGPYRCVVSDPPWLFSDRLPGKNRGAIRNYHCLTVQQICDFPLPPIADDAYLFLWRVSAMVEDAYLVCRHWGFEPKSEIVWNKLTKNGLPWFGMGRHVRASHESAILAVRGRPKPLARNIRSVFSAQAAKSKHSKKPEEFFDLIERLAPGPYLELFARRQRPGWTCLGDQA